MNATCSSGIGLLMDYLEEALPLDRRAELEAHVTGCPLCQAFLASYRETPRVLREATLAAPPPDLARLLVEFVRNRN